MNYHPDVFIELMDEVERQGGAHLPERCEPGAYDLDMPAGNGRRTTKTIKTAGCGSEAKFVIPYDPAAHVSIPGYDSRENPATAPKKMVPTVAEANAAQRRSGGMVSVCAVDDNVGLWPRFQEAMKNAG